MSDKWACGLLLITMLVSVFGVMLYATIKGDYESPEPGSLENEVR